MYTDDRRWTYTYENAVITLIRLEGKLFSGLDHLSLKFLDFLSKNGFGRSGRVDTAGLDGDDDVTTVLQEVVRVQSYDTGLIRLGDCYVEKAILVCRENTSQDEHQLTIGEHDIDHRDKHPVFGWVTSILDNGDDVGPFLGHVDEITTGSVRELDGVDGSLGSDDIGYVGNGGTAERYAHNELAQVSVKKCDLNSRGSSQVEHLGARLDVDVVKTSQDTGSQLASEGVPNSELGLVLASVYRCR
jgi:hypothetical protein